MLGSTRRTLLRACACTGAALAVSFGAAPAANAATDYMLIDSAQLASLPTSGAAYTAMKKTADNAMATMSLTAPTSKSPWLPNYGDSSTGVGNGAATLAAALVYARTGDARYRDFVIRVNRFVIGSEDSSSTNGTGAADRLLGTMRQISGYVLAADLVRMDPSVTGSRSGYTSTVWKTWLGALRTKSIGSGTKSSIVMTDNNSATNWGAWASASRTAIDVYLNDTADLAAAVARLKLYLGESTTGTPWIKSTSYDASWVCTAAGAVQFTAVNGSSCGSGKDGIIVEDASRSAAPFPAWGKAGIDYSFHAYGAQLVAALLLDRKGYDVWNWGDRALKRIMDRLDRLGVATGNGRATATHVSWIPRHFYNSSYPTVPARPSDTLGYTDWLYGAAASPAPAPVPSPAPSPAPSPVPPVSAKLIMGSQVAGTVWTGMTVNAKRASRLSFSAPATANVTAIKAYVDGGGATTGSQPLRGLIYSDSPTGPSKPVATSSAVAVSARQAAGWITLSFASPVRLAAGSYWLALHSGGTSKVARYAATTATSALRYDTAGDTYSDGATSPFGSTSIDNKQLSIVAIGT
jgi:hypothetical protein